jgi:hypothetical protein
MPAKLQGCVSISGVGGLTVAAAAFAAPPALLAEDDGLVAPPVGSTAFGRHHSIGPGPASRQRSTA